MLSLFFQVTVVPAVTLIVAGVKAIFIMLTVLAAGGVLGVLLLVPLLLEQEINMVDNSKLKVTTLAILFFIFLILNCEIKMITYLFHL
jgi:hypothetical protein